MVMERRKWGNPCEGGAVPMNRNKERKKKWVSWRDNKKVKRNSKRIISFTSSKVKGDG